MFDTKDLKKTYDKVNRKALWDFLKSYGERICLPKGAKSFTRMCASVHVHKDCERVLGLVWVFDTDVILS